MQKIDQLRAEIEQRLRERQLDFHPRIFASLESTNAWLMEHEARMAEGTLVLADCQTGGRGRLGRTWQASEHSLCFSILWRPCLPLAELSAIPLMVAVAIADACDDLGVDVQLKWPNDILGVRSGRKLCGILTEMRSSPDGDSSLILGIGCNLNQREFPGELATFASSLALESGKVFRKVDTLEQILYHLQRRYRQYCSGQRAAILERWRQRCRMFGGRYWHRESQQSLLVRDITQEGALMVEYPDGSEGVLHSGEVCENAPGN